MDPTWTIKHLLLQYKSSISGKNGRWKQKQTQKKIKKFNLWIQPEPPNTYHSIDIQSMERLEDENKNKQKNSVQSMEPTWTAKQRSKHTNSFKRMLILVQQQTNGIVDQTPDTRPPNSENILPWLNTTAGLVVWLS